MHCVVPCTRGPTMPILDRGNKPNERKDLPGSAISLTDLPRSNLNSARSTRYFPRIDGNLS
ncbi:hypothetical protein BLA39750_06517 [Burkholderia lata]|uniref:Uncharacterized protein n=1 Tax=Burkholderia lata (strain ATCC 17760 / DSM 23089 / LMG 22485 / NCIMB 9086 / R18194 / 383) TaxID=482957 RepID=A0A6P3B566_BURL3|nr:hypothetical protein BLA39750_06517 [Burkholderia lata]